MYRDVVFIDKIEYQKCYYFSLIYNSLITNYFDIFLKILYFFNIYNRIYIEKI